MSVYAAVMTGKGVGPISTVQIFGDCAEATIKEIFKPIANKPLIFKPGQIRIGTITTKAETIDQVAIGCEGADNFAIHSHGNPIIVSSLMQLLRDNGATVVTVEELLVKILTSQKDINTIELEARLAQKRAVTIAGTKIIANQIDAGLTKKAATLIDAGFRALSML